MLPALAGVAHHSLGAIYGVATYDVLSVTNDEQHGKSSISIAPICLICIKLSSYSIKKDKSNYLDNIMAMSLYIWYR